MHCLHHLLQFSSAPGTSFVFFWCSAVRLGQSVSVPSVQQARVAPPVRVRPLCLSGAPCVHTDGAAVRGGRTLTAAAESDRTRQLNQTGEGKENRRKGKGKEETRR
jgi:hypothetical protein